MREPGRPDDVADGVDVRLSGRHPLIDDNMGFLDLHLGAVEAEILDIADNADGEDSAIGLDFARLAAGFDGGGDAVGILLQGLHRGAGHDRHALLLEALAREGGNLLVLDRQDAVEHLDHRHIGAKIAIEAGEFDAYCSRPNDQQRFRHAGRHHRLFIGPDQLAVGLEPGQRAGAGAAGDDDVLRGELGSGLAAHLHLALAGQHAGALEDGDLVLLHQEGDAARELARDFPRTLDDLFEIEAPFLGGEAVLTEMPEQMRDFRRAQQRLGRDAAPVEADAAEQIALDHRGLHAQLRGANGGDIAARPAADDDHVEGSLGHKAPALFRC